MGASGSKDMLRTQFAGKFDKKSARPPRNKLKYSKEGREQMKAMLAASGPQPWKKHASQRSVEGSGQDTLDTGFNQKNKNNKKTGFRIGPKPAPGVYTGKGALTAHRIAHNSR